MKRLALLLSLVLLVAVPLLADCPEVLNLDDLPCAPCPYLWTGWWWSVGTYADGSELSASGDALTNCDGDHQHVVNDRSYWCPNGPDDEQCIARQHYLNP